jgi:hypothetical protein
MPTISTTLTFIEDPGHGWLRVPLADVAALGIQDEITAYSFIDNDYAFPSAVLRTSLEEDCDYGTFMNACQAQNVLIPDMKTEYVSYFDRSQASFTLDRFQERLASAAVDKMSRSNPVTAQLSGGDNGNH